MGMGVQVPPGAPIIRFYMLKKVNFYHTIIGELVQNVAPILNTLFVAKFQVLAICENEEIMNETDAKLWTFASNLFIPHGLSTDPQPEIQPIIFFNLLENITNVNNANCLVLITKNLLKDIDKISELLFKMKEIETLVCIFISNDQETKQNIELLNTFVSTQNKYFTDISGKWQEHDTLLL